MLLIHQKFTQEITIKIYDSIEEATSSQLGMESWIKDTQIERDNQNKPIISIRSG